MAGVGVAQLQDLAGTATVVRAMSSPAAELGLAYSPWYAAPGVGVEDKALVSRLFAACGVTDEVPEEAQLDTFTAITGPVPGFVALFADSMRAYAVRQGWPRQRRSAPCGSYSSPADRCWPLPSRRQRRMCAP